MGNILLTDETITELETKIKRGDLYTMLCCQDVLDCIHMARAYQEMRAAQKDPTQNPNINTGDA